MPLPVMANRRCSVGWMRARVARVVAEDAAGNDVVVFSVGLPGERVADDEARPVVCKALAAALDHGRGEVEPGVARLHAARAQPGEQVAEAAADVEQAGAIEVAQRGKRAE